MAGHIGVLKNVEQAIPIDMLRKKIRAEMTP